MPYTLFFLRGKLYTFKLYFENETVFGSITRTLGQIEVATESRVEAYCAFYYDSLLQYVL